MNYKWFLVLTLLSKLAFGQSFEGEITYATIYKSKVASFTDAQWGSIVGTQNQYFIKGGNYKSILNGSVISSYLYRQEDNKLYTEFQDGNIMYWNDASENKDSVISFEIKKNAARILNYNCDELILHCKKGTEIYDYAPQLMVDAGLFINHKFGNWYDYIRLAKAIPLHMEIEQDQVIITSEATAVKAEKLSDDLFVLPADVKLVKSPY
jgi:hypothetical protein